MSLVTVEDFAAFNTEIDPDDPAVILSLEAASDAIERYCNRSFAQADYTVTLVGSGTSNLLLANPPVSVVASVTEIDGDTETLLETTDYTFTVFGELHRLTWLWYSWLTYEVAYTSGFDPIPFDIQMACIRMASSTLTSGATEQTVSKIQLGSFAETYATATATTSATDVERDTLDLYRLITPR